MKFAIKLLAYCEQSSYWMKLHMYINIITTCRWTSIRDKIYIWI